MKWTIILFLYVLVFAGACSTRHAWEPILPNPVTLEEGFTVEERGPGVLLVTHRFPWNANSLVVMNGKGGALLIDTPWTSEATEILVQWLERDLKVIQFAALNSHWHLDNAGGNRYLRERGIPVHGSEVTAGLIGQRGGENLEQLIHWLDPEKYEDEITVFQMQQPVPPWKTFPLPEVDQSISRIILDIPLEIYFPGEGHSMDNLGIYIEDRNVLFGGCLIKSEDTNNLGNLNDGNPEMYASSVENMIQRFGNMNDLVVIPGHGFPGDTGLLYHTRELAQ